MAKERIWFVDLFAGAGGLSEGFMQEGFSPVAHVEMDENACYTLKTRECYHYLRRHGKKEQYYRYLKNQISRDELYKLVPAHIIDSVICETMSKEGMPALFCKIDKLMKRKKADKIDIMIGGPPCQAYSVVGRARKKDMAQDPRNYLYKLYLQAVDKYKPKMIVFENVPGILSAGKSSHFTDLKKRLEELGYTVDYRLCNAADYGVLQNRKRIILVGWKKDTDHYFPKMKTVDTSAFTVKNLFDDLPAIEPGQSKDQYSTTEINKYLRLAELRDKRSVLTLHKARTNRELDREIYKEAINMMNKEKKRLIYSELPDRLKKHNNTIDFQDRFKVVASCEHVSQTMVAHIAKDGHYYIHPDYSQARSISIREAARIQSFPDDYYFEGGQTAAFRQIGNAVPPLMARAIAKAIKEQWGAQQ